MRTRYTLTRAQNTQQAATVWYHDHALGITRLSTAMGLAGFYIIKDEALEESLGLPQGEYDMPGLPHTQEVLSHSD